MTPTHRVRQVIHVQGSLGGGGVDPTREVGAVHALVERLRGGRAVLRLTLPNRGEDDGPRRVVILRSQPIVHHVRIRLHERLQRQRAVIRDAGGGHGEPVPVLVQKIDGGGETERFFADEGHLHRKSLLRDADHLPLRVRQLHRNLDRIRGDAVRDVEVIESFVDDVEPARRANAEGRGRQSHLANVKRQSRVRPLAVHLELEVRRLRLGASVEVHGNDRRV